MKQKIIPTLIRFTEDERAWLNEKVENNGRTLSGQVRIWLKKEREQENARTTETTN